MLSENIRRQRKAKGLSQEELACRLNVVRQTVSKWERGLSVPDAELLIALSDTFEVPVGALLGKTIQKPEADDLEALAKKLEIINLQLAQIQSSKRRALCWLFTAFCAIVVLIFIALLFLGSPYQSWDFNNPETAVAGTLYHGFEWAFVRLAPFVFAGSLVGALLTWKRT